MICLNCGSDECLHWCESCGLNYCEYNEGWHDDCETANHDPPDSRNHMAKPYDDALIGNLRNNPPRNE